MCSFGLPVEGARPGGQGQRHEYDQRTDPGGRHDPDLGDDVAPRPGAEGDADVKGSDVQAGRHIDRMRCLAFRLLHQVELQTGDIAEGDGAPEQNGEHHQPL